VGDAGRGAIGGPLKELAHFRRPRGLDFGRLIVRDRPLRLDLASELHMLLARKSARLLQKLSSGHAFKGYGATFDLARTHSCGPAVTLGLG
jgi:hypothetical protein